MLGSLSFALVLGLSSVVRAAPAVDPCAKIAGQTFAVPSDALACLKSFPFNETLRQNVMHNVARVFDFYTFEDYALNSPPPFQESTVNIRAEIARINSSHYAVRVFRLYTKSIPVFVLIYTFL